MFTQCLQVSHTGRNEGRLCIHCLLQFTVRPLKNKAAKRKSKHLIALFEHRTAVRKSIIYILTHTNCLCTLAGKNKCNFTHKSELLLIERL
ncbi:hypothetical protein D3C85_1457740 [compost metagenome]